MPEYTGNTSGAGNPPGKHSDSYLKSMQSKGHFVDDSSYKNWGGLSAPGGEVGNQPKQKSMSSLESESKKKDSL